MAAVEDGQVIGCDTLDIWNEYINKGKEAEKLIVVHFSASWCGPCREISKFVTKIAMEFPNILFLKVNAFKLPNLTEEWKVEAFPLFVFLKDGNEIERVLDPKNQQLYDKIRNHS